MRETKIQGLGYKQKKKETLAGRRGKFCSIRWVYALGKRVGPLDFKIKYSVI
jgi:hypothetical protein